ncbi:MAG: regulatory protein RecX [Blautia sp.]|nr:regulatory protein RecX [Blautia sp.]
MNMEEQKEARKKALKLLEYMDRTEKGLSDRLRQAGFSAELSKDAIEYVKSFGYLDDHRYAVTYITGRIQDKSRQKILMELVQKGISRQTAEHAWEEAANLLAPDEHKVLCETITKKYPVGSELNEKEMRRLQGYLLRRGFSCTDVYSALEELNIRLICNETCGSYL